MASPLVRIAAAVDLGLHAGAVRMCRLRLPASEGSIKLLRYLHTAEWEAAERLQINDEVSRQTARILRSHMRYVLDHSIRSIAFLDEVSGR